MKAPKHAPDWLDEFAHPEKTTAPNGGTWTLVVMTSLKPAGQRMQTGWIRRMLRAGLPLSPTITIIFNDEPLTPLRSEVNIATQWPIGPGLGIPEIDVPKSETDSETLKVTEVAQPIPHITIEGLPEPITGNVYLYADRISGGKSDEYGSSNGFFVNVRGRVINAEDADFGISNLSHSAWAKFRACIRADGLDAALAITREDIKKTREVRIFKALLLALFNKVRNEDTRLTRAGWPNAGQVLSDTWTAIPFEPLRKLIGERLGSAVGLPSFVTMEAGADESAIQQEWAEITQEKSGKIIENVVFEPLSADAPLAQYDVVQRRILVNKNHPFTLEHSETHEEQEFVRNVAILDLLTDSYILDLGVDETRQEQIREYRDQILRLLAQVNRRSGTTIAQLLMQAGSSVKGLEKIVGDALRYLGFAVEVLGQSGEPEGVATAPLPRDPRKPQDAASYRFTYDAKSTSHSKVTTQNLGIAGLARHRADKEAQHTLVVAPEFTVADALLTECGANEVTPMRTKDLATLVLLTASVGSLDLVNFRSVFSLTHPDQVGKWVDDLQKSYDEKVPPLSLELFFKAVEAVGYDGPNAISASVIADRISVLTGKSKQPTVNEVCDVVRGLTVLVPHLIRLTNGRDIHFSASPLSFRQALAKQIQRIPPEYRFGYMKSYAKDPA